MSHYADYISERLGKLCYECEKGFATYFYTGHPQYGDVVYIEDIFVTAAHRRAGVASEMADYVAEEARGKGVKVMLGSVNPQARGATASLKALLAYGMSLDRVGADGLIYFVKDLED